ncbi:MAG: phosphopantothenoylcysteine decarboxylase [Clostridiales bacterium]|jgi:phosphopantothenoylcysteine decarboxylase/phosphopantothenoylcysteine decarboxylase/phosphopantothenate--cysteine ligase|nr:phosphopantothenoylcysteine decarboxylase [Clostridiales bacterium]
MAEPKKIVLGITGSIAAYKAADIVSGLKKLGCDVHVMMTKSATEFITPLTLQTLSKNTVYTGVFQEDCPAEVKHITMAQSADLLLIAPATANIIGKLANGIADDMLTSLYLAVQQIPMLIAPAMNTRMYENKVVSDNLKKLTENGFTLIEPKESLLACGAVGKGALADVNEILAAVKTALML